MYLRRAQARTFEALLGSILIILVTASIIGGALYSQKSSRDKRIEASIFMKVLMYEGYIEDLIQTGNPSKVESVAELILGNTSWNLKVVSIANRSIIVEVGDSVVEENITLWSIYPGIKGSFDPLNVTIAVRR